MRVRRRWVESVIVGGIYPGGKYNDAEFEPREVGAVMTYNRVVGKIRLRTVRAAPDVGCPDPSLSKQLVMNSTGHIYTRKFVEKCYAKFCGEGEAFCTPNEDQLPYSIGKELTDEHGSCDAIPAPPPPPDKYTLQYGAEAPTDGELDAMAVRKLCRAFTYTPVSETREEKYDGILGTYTGGGYIRDIDNPVDCDTSADGVCERGTAARADLLLALEQLRDNTWLDEATRVMLMKMTFYNANLKFFMSITFAFEFSLGGTVYPTTRMAIADQELYSMELEGAAPGDIPPILNTFVEFIVNAFVVYYTYVQLRLIYHSFKTTGGIGEYLSDLFNILESIVLVFFYLSTYMRLTLLSRLYPAAAIFEDEYTDYAAIGALYTLSFNLDSVCVIALFFKALKYAQLNTSTSMLWSVLTRAGKDMGYFIIMLIILMLAFAMMAMQFFGSQLMDYSNLGKAVVSLLLVLLGQFDIAGMRQASPYLGIAFFFAYIVIMVLIMMNIFLAILGEAYTVVRGQQDEEKRSRVKVAKKRSLLGYLKLVRQILKARWEQRGRKKQGLAAGKGAAGAAAAHDAAENGGKPAKRGLFGKKKPKDGKATKVVRIQG